MPRPKKSAANLEKPRRVTLQDIADVAGLNVMTVSHALSGSSIVAPATRERIKRIAKELKYVPNSAARALATGRTGLVAVMSGPIDEPYYATMVRQLARTLNAEGYKILLTSTEVEDLLDAAGNMAIDGAIAIDRHVLIEQFQVHSPVPCVSIGTYERSFIDNIVVDLWTGSVAALEMMLVAGRQRIAYVVTSFALAAPAEVRAKAYFETLQKAGKKSEVIDLSTNTLPEIAPRLKTYIQEHGCPDALFCQNDETAMGAYLALRELGHRIPEEVMLVGCDGQLHMSYFDPPLSTIMQPIEQMCATAWTFLKNRMSDPDLPFQQAVFEGKLVVRESLGG